MIFKLFKRIRREIELIYNIIRNFYYKVKLNFEFNHFEKKLSEINGVKPTNRASLALKYIETNLLDRINEVLDIGSGSGYHSEYLKRLGLNVTSFDFGTSYYFKMSSNQEFIKGDFNTYNFTKKYDLTFASHVLEHQPNVHDFIRKMIFVTKPSGYICITVPPRKDLIVGGHLTLWNSGLLLYNMSFAGLDLSDCILFQYGYNITIITKNILRSKLTLDYDKGDILKLLKYLPEGLSEPFDGNIYQINYY